MDIDNEKEGKKVDEAKDEVKGEDQKKGKEE